ncbi:myosin-7B-like [Daphnia magna]|uniref:myosin-7B-like n=1 Tax=Daphnia magna TaxID=35525 RepID=UPI001E1BC7CB|nr:myosin-7B-like [Daphnia magna]
MNQIDEFLEESGASPADIRSLATDVLSNGISLRPEQITDLARRINDTISSLTNIVAILSETSGDLASAKALKDRADTAKAHAQGILTVVQQVLDSFAAAKAAQDKAEEAIQTADKEKDISAAESHLSETADAQAKAIESVQEVEGLRERLRELQRKLIKNERDVKEATRESDVAASLATRAGQGASELDTAYQRALRALEEKTARSGDARERSDRLQDKANRLTASVFAKVQELKEMEDEYLLHERRLTDLSEQVMAMNVRMTDYLQVISDRSEFYRTCQK